MGSPFTSDHAAADAVLEDLRSADLTPYEMRTMLVYLSGYSPDGTAAALRMIREHRDA